MSGLKNTLIFVPGINALTHQERFTTIYDFPRGALSLGSFLEAGGCSAVVVPLDYYIRPSKHQSFLDDQIRSVVESAIQEHSPSLIGVSVPYTMLYPVSLKIIEYCKEVAPSVLTCLGGSHASHQDSQCFEDSPSVDVVVRGEGEWTLLELAQKIIEGMDFGEVAGITFRKDGQVRKNPPRPLGDINALAPLDYSLLPEEFVRNMAISVVASRGCAFKCTFCNESRFWGQKVRMPTISSIVEELKDLADNYGNYPVGLEDSMFNMRTSYFFDLCSSLSRLTLNPNFYILSRVDSVTPEGLAAMRNAGIRNLVLGIENASPKVLKAMDKRVTIEDAERVCLEATKQGIIVGAFWILGHPGDSPREAEITLEAIDRLYSKGILRTSEIALFVPYPGTTIFEQPEEYGLEILNYDWEKWGRFNTEPVCQLKDFPAEEIVAYWKNAKELSDRWMRMPPQPVMSSQSELLNQDSSMGKPGRNSPCPCGSGKKYKKCCGKNAY